MGNLNIRIGVYVLDTTHSPKRGVNVYSQEGASGVHMHQATEGRWCISDTADMVSGFAGGWIVSTTVSPSPLGLQWKYIDGSGTFHLDPLLTVTEST